MQLPNELQQAIEELVQPLATKNLKAARERVSEDYRKGFRSSFQYKEQLLSYLVTRMPATFAANVKVFQAIRERLPQFQCKRLLDLGAGPGTATWAALEVFPDLSELHLVERENAAIEMGKKLAAQSPVWQNAKWQQAYLEGAFPVPPADLAVLSYVFAELKNHALLNRLWESPISVYAIIEPGTPKGFERIRAIRDEALKKGAQLIAPCPHQFSCPMPANDWCHFSARVERTRLHRQLKEGSLGYEDEKYSYVVYAKPNFVLTPIEGRVVRPPQKGSGHVRLALCANDGRLKEKPVTKSDKERYRAARDAEWGSVWL